MSIPRFGLGTARLDDEAIAALVVEALDVGYRFIDTAASYENEAGVGEGVRRSGVGRDDLFLTTKLRGADQGFKSTKAALARSLDTLGTDHVDLYLIHWPLPRIEAYVDSWRAMIELQEQGLATHIGVSNFLPEHLDRLEAETGVVPAVNQIELHPRFPQAEQRADDDRRGIVTQSWSPLGQDGTLLTDPVVLEVAGKHGRTAAQVILRWHLDLGLSVIPKASSRSRLAENLGALDFTLDDDDLRAFVALETGKRVNDQHPNVWEEF